MTTPINQSLAERTLAKWARQTAQLQELRPRMPLQTFTREALNVAHIIEDFWETTVVDGVKRHGLDSVEAGGAVRRETATEIRELQMAVSEAQANYAKLVQYIDSAPVEEGDAMLDELQHGLAFLLEDGQHEHGSRQLAQIRDMHGDARSQDAMAMALEAYAELAEEYKAELKEFDIFPLSVIDDALSVARDLRERSIERTSGELFARQRELISLRNRLVAGLNERVSNARRAIRYVFRHDEAILKRAASAYMRSARRSAKDDATRDVANSDVANSEVVPTSAAAESQAETTLLGSAGPPANAAKTGVN